MKRTLQVVGILLIVAGILIFFATMNQSLLSDPYIGGGVGYIESMMSFLSYSITPILLIIGGFLLLGTAKLIEVQERSSEMTTALLKQLLEMKNEAQAPSAPMNNTHIAADEQELTAEIEEELPFQENERKYWHG
ncbi:MULTISPECIES: hypothetical protein [Bacillus]|uniref:Uncharacterized protein n=2 Tax=Bacillus TaxID=1386 RepID=A0A0M3RA01_9BACI|nr:MULTISPECIES: hypothetical protein [Bacillus]ALC82316.1 hypothetical protein AM592_12535 [Bacillus gobiensis]MBP1081179.1 sulfite exporter TauE/SafE [Bacillus capparidis]MED1095861.1 hypothetical protein [Bacillus capparidis]